MVRNKHIWHPNPPIENRLESLIYLRNNLILVKMEDLNLSLQVNVPQAKREDKQGG